MKPKLTIPDYVAAAGQIGCGVSIVRALADKESNGGGFLKGQILIVRFEGHIFRQKTGGKFDKSHPTLSHPYMKNCPYNKGTISDWRRLEAARKLAGDVAFECASYGMFQCMGFHYKTLGYNSAYAMVQAFNQGEGPQLAGFIRIIRSMGLVPALRNLRFTEIAETYNGTNHADNGYVPFLRQATAYYAANPLTTVRFQA